MEYFGFMAGIILGWAWCWPHSFGQWLEAVKDPYRLKPQHQKKRKT